MYAKAKFQFNERERIINHTKIMISWIVSNVPQPKCLVDRLGSDELLYFKREAEDLERVMAPSAPIPARAAVNLVSIERSVRRAKLSNWFYKWFATLTKLIIKSLIN